jgi:GABA(A) receptor-associated protein
MTFSSEFKKKYTLEERKAESTKMLSKFPDKVPVIVEKLLNSNLPTMDRKKFLVPQDIMLAQFLSIIRKRLNITPETAIFVFFGNKNTLAPATALMSNVYTSMKDDDDFLYCYYTSENTFG